MILDGNSIILHAVLDDTSPYASPLYELKPNSKTNFVPSLEELQPIGSTEVNELYQPVTANTKFNALGFSYPAVDVKVVEATEAQYLEIISRYVVWANAIPNVSSGLDLEGNLVTKNGQLAWLEYWYNNLIDNTLGYSTLTGTITERFAADYSVPSGANIIEYYPDGSHIKSGKIKLYSVIGNTSKYTWNAWKTANNGTATVIYTLSNAGVGSDIYSDTALTTNGNSVSSISGLTLTDNLGNTFTRFEHLDIVNHLDSEGYQSVGYFTKGLFKGCSTNMNIEVTDRIISIARAYFKHYFGTDKFDGYTAHGMYRSVCGWQHWIPNNQYHRYFDRENEYIMDLGTKIYSTRLGCMRSLYDIFEDQGFKVVIHSPFWNMEPVIEGQAQVYESQSDNRNNHLYGNKLSSASDLLTYPALFQGSTIASLAQVKDVFDSVDNWGKYLIEHAGETVTGKSGAKYVVLTSKHHDGVALWDTQYSDRNTVKHHSCY